MTSTTQIRVIVKGSSALGRDVVRGVMEYTHEHALNWRLHVELEPQAVRGSDWANDDASILAVPDQAFVDQQIRSGHPLVNCLAHYEDSGLPTVRTDDFAAGVMAAEHLIARGFERYIYWATGDFSKAANLRYEGFRTTAEQQGHSVWRIPDKPIDVDHVELLIDELQKIDFPIGLMCGHDGLGRLITNRLEAAGIGIPEQVGVIGVDNDLFQCELSTPPLSSVEMPHEDLGYDAARMLDRLLRSKPLPSPLILPPVGVVTRRSTDVVAVEDPQLARAVRFIREHACDPCTVNDVVADLQASRRWLELHFAKQFGRSPHQEIVRVRIDRARYLLRGSRISVQRIAERCGYPLLHNFGRAFKQATGQTPAAYRRGTRAKGISR